MRNPKRTPPAPTPPPPGRFSSALVQTIAVATLAMTARLLFVLTSPDRTWPHSVYFEGDAPLFARFAATLSRGESFERDLAIHSPVVPYLLKWMGFGSGATDFTAPKVLWCILSAAGCAMAYLAIRRTASNRIAWIAAIWLTFSFGGYVAANSLNNETIYTFVLMAIVLATLRFSARPGLLIAILLGGLHGLASLTRAEHTLLLILLVGVMLWNQRPISADRQRVSNRRFMLQMATMAAVFVTVCLPWSIHGSRAARRMNELGATVDYAGSSVPWSAGARNLLDSLPAFARTDNFEAVNFLAVRYGVREVTEANLRELFEKGLGYLPEPMSTRVFVSSQGPLCFALANHPAADGGFSKAALLWPGIDDVNLQLSRPMHLKLYNHGYEVGLEYIREDVGRWMRLVGEKLMRFADGAALGIGAYNLPYGRQGNRPPVDLMTPPPDAVKRKVLFAGLVFVGMILAGRRQIGCLWAVVVIYKLIVTVLFFGYARQAVSILPALVFFGAIAVDAGYCLLERATGLSRRGSMALLTTAIAGLLILDVSAALRPAKLTIDGRPLSVRDGRAEAFETFREIIIGSHWDARRGVRQ